MRMALELMYGLDTYHDTWITNALKCDPGKRKPLESQHLKPCATQWLGSELALLNEYAPTVPLLIAGPQAFRALKILYPKETSRMKSLGFNGCRRRGDLRVYSRPVVMCDNPARAARSEPKIETRVGYGKEGWKVTRNEWLYPTLPGSPIHSFIQDLKFLKPFLESSHV